MSSERRIVQLPNGVGLPCRKCGAALPAVTRTITSEGFVIRERKCPECKELNITDERVISSRPTRRVVIKPSDYR